MMHRTLYRYVPALLLWAVCASTPTLSQPAGTPFLRRPDIHGDQVVFSCEGDLWLGSVASGATRRVTNHPGTESHAKFSPDGRMIAFTGQYDGGTDVYVISVEGGAPDRLTWDPAGARVQGWTPDGKSVLFRSRRDSAERVNRLWSVPASGGIPTVYKIPRVEVSDISFDGKKIAYVPMSAEWQNWKRYVGGQADDIWLADLQAQSFRKLTTYVGIDTSPAWTREALFFTSERDGISNLYQLNPETGQVTPATTYTDAPVRYPASDGSRVIFEYGRRLGLFDPKTSQARELTMRVITDRIHTREERVDAREYLNSVAIGPTGKRVVLEARGQMISVPVEEGDWRVLSPQPGARHKFPVWSPDGNQIAFISDRSGEEQIWLVPSTGSGEPKQLTKDHVGPLGSIEWSPDGKYLATGDHEMRILLVDAKSGETRIVAQGDRSGTYHGRPSGYEFSPDGKWLAYTDVVSSWTSSVWLYEIATETKTRISPEEINASGPAWDPKGKFLYYLADRSFDPRGGGVTSTFYFEKTTRISMLTLAKGTASPFLIANNEEGTAVEKKDEKTPEKKDEKKEDKDKKEPADAKEAKPDAKLPVVKIDLEGLTERIIDVPVPSDRYFQIAAVENRLLMGVNADVGGEGTRNQLKALNMKEPRKREITTVADRISSFDVSSDGKKLLVMFGRDMNVADVSAGTISATTGRVDINTVALTIDPVEEWKQIFHEGWRAVRDFFYAPNMHGVDWNAVRMHYAAQLPNVGDRSELNELLGEMMAELSTGHAYVGGGDTPAGSRRIPMGYLGADFEAVEDGPAYRIVRIYPGDGYDLAARSPLLAPGVDVKEGDYILAISGQPARADKDINAFLSGTPGRVVTLTVNDKPTMKGSREVRVRPMGDDSQARYYAWAESRREYVRKNGGENLGYVHIPDMGDGGLTEFGKHYYPITQTKDGIVFDVRNNGGGYISGMLLVHMSHKPYHYFKPRYGVSWTRQDMGFGGYMVALCNENSGSNAEEFSDGFQRLKLGPVIGLPTWGGLVGSGGGWTLVDGGRIYPPNYAAWSPEAGWIVEGSGAQPDIRVEQDPNALLAGKDPQLDAAIAYLKDRIAKVPVPRPEPPPFPDKSLKPTAAAARP